MAISKFHLSLVSIFYCSGGKSTLYNFAALDHKIFSFIPGSQSPNPSEIHDCISSPNKEVG
jgi:hypothetical protein